MNDPSTNDHARWFADVRRIIDLAEVTPGLPIPFISRDRASFYFTAIAHAGDAREAMTAASTVLSYALGVEFTGRAAPAMNTRHYALEALLPSGLLVALVGKAEHMAAEEAAAAAVAAIRAVARERNDAIMTGSAT
jgi:hypothetical protein